MVILRLTRVKRLVNRGCLYRPVRVLEREITPKYMVILPAECCLGQLSKGKLSGGVQLPQG